MPISSVIVNVPDVSRSDDVNVASESLSQWVFRVTLTPAWGSCFFLFLMESRRPCAVVAVVKSSSMVVVCFSELLMRRMSSANLRVGDVSVVVLLDESDSVVTSVPLFC